MQHVVGDTLRKIADAKNNQQNQLGRASQNSRSDPRQPSARYPNNRRSEPQGTRYPNNRRSEPQAARYSNNGQQGSQGARYPNSGRQEPQGTRYPNNGVQGSQGTRYPNNGRQEPQGTRYQQQPNTYFDTRAPEQQNSNRPTTTVSQCHTNLNDCQSMLEKYQQSVLNGSTPSLNGNSSYGLTPSANGNSSYGSTPSYQRQDPAPMYQQVPYPSNPAQYSGQNSGGQPPRRNPDIRSEYLDEQGDVPQRQIQRRVEEFNRQRGGMRRQKGGDAPLPPIRYIKIAYPDGQTGWVQVSQLAVYDTNNVNVAQGKPVTAANSWTGTMSDKDRIVNGTLAPVEYPASGYASIGAGPGDYIMVDLQAEIPVTKIVYYNRQDCCSDRAQGMVLSLMDGNMNVVRALTLSVPDLIQPFTFQTSTLPPSIPPIRYVFVNSSTPGLCIQISQIAVYSIENPGTNIAQGKPTNSQGSYTGQSISANAVDGSTGGPRPYPSIYHSPCGTGDFWSVDLGAEFPVNKIDYYNRADCCQDRAMGLILELRDGNNKAVWSGPFTSADNVQTFMFKPQITITDPFRFMPIVQKCVGYTNQVKTGPEYERSFFKQKIAEVCMPYYTTELDKCEAHETKTISEIGNKIAKCAATLDTCQTAFNINTRGIIRSALYGNRSTKQLMDVKALINTMRTTGTNDIVASNTTFGSDPAPGLPKALYLTVHTSYNANQKYIVPEGKSINLDMPDTTAPNNPGPGATQLTFSTLGQGQSGGKPLNQRGGWISFSEPTFVSDFISSVEHTVLPSTIPLDKNPNCKVWARKRPSECTTNPTFMTANCATSCAAAPQGAPVSADLKRANETKYSIEHHREFPQFLQRYKSKHDCPDKRYVLKSEVAPVFDQTLRLVQKLNDLKSNFSTDISNHPDYHLLMDKVALKDANGKYIPCSKC